MVPKIIASNPWELVSGGTALYTGNLVYAIGLTNAETGFLGCLTWVSLFRGTYQSRWLPPDERRDLPLHDGVRQRQPDGSGAHPGHGAALWQRPLRAWPLGNSAEKNRLIISPKKVTTTSRDLIKERQG